MRKTLQANTLIYMERDIVEGLFCFCNMCSFKVVNDNIKIHLKLAKDNAFLHNILVNVDVKHVHIQ